MGFRRHIVIKCHTCKSRHVKGGSKKGGSFDEARRLGWGFMLRSTLGDHI